MNQLIHFILKIFGLILIFVGVFMLSTTSSFWAGLIIVLFGVFLMWFKNER
ncbi:hypothetical protein HOA55_05035 [archaeon]|nr:hypothetical protein [archaeon]MBT6820693.1 hypothetical protein [archaeon]MBT6955879.1 hypothetical protein [archaeon]MBT7567903.1 hypothetical protein [archaeon]